jgi:MFS family permease
MVAGGQLAALPEFQRRFGYPQPDGSYLIPAHYLSAWSSIGPACEIVSTFIFAPLLERFGRKAGILAASLISTAGVILQQLELIGECTWPVEVSMVRMGPRSADEARIYDFCC